jgi:plasmid stability protein
LAGCSEFCSISEQIWKRPENISIKNVPADKVDRLRVRAKRNHRSLQGELLALIDAAIETEPGKLPIEQIAAKAGKLRLARRNEATKPIREDRDRQGRRRLLDHRGIVQ